MEPSEAIQALRDAGLTEAEIGARVGARQSTINRIRRGEMLPNYTIGKALVDFAEAVQRGAAASEESDRSRQLTAANEGDAAPTDGTPIPLKQAA